MVDSDAELGNQEAFYLSIHCPIVSTDEIAGLVHTIARNRSGEQISLPALGQWIGYDEERLLALLDLLDRLDLAKLVADKVELTPVGRRYALASGQARRRIFADQLTDRIPLVKLVQGKITANPVREVHLAEIAADLRNQYPAFDIDRGLRQLIDWARYAGLFSYDDRTGVITLDPPTTGRR
jgi:NitT/TauT family transport system ATP-binding protein